MLFFIDECWKTTPNGKHKVGVLTAIQIKSHDFNRCSNDFYQMKVARLGKEAGSIEIKGKKILRPYLFRLERLKGVRSDELGLARDIFTYMTRLGTVAFASVVFAEKEIELSCADPNLLERPFLYLFERINLFMQENQPGLMAKIVIDDRGLETNQKISAAVSNFLHKSQAGRSFDRILKFPTFAISNQNCGIQFADMVAYTLGSRFTGDRGMLEFFKMAKALEFTSRTMRDVGGGKQMPWKGFKVINKVVKEKEAGGLLTPGGVK